MTDGFATLSAAPSLVAPVLQSTDAPRIAGSTGAQRGFSSVAAAPHVPLPAERCVPTRSAVILSGSVGCLALFGAGLRRSKRRCAEGAVRAGRASACIVAAAKREAWLPLANGVESTAQLDEPSRRSAVIATGAAMLVPQLALPAPAAAERLATLTGEALERAKGKVVVITGATAGVGLEAARTLVRAGADVYVTGRTLAKATAAAADVTSGGVASAGRAIPLELNLASLASVRSFADKMRNDVKRPIDILACNAGLALGQDLKEPEFTEDGFELTVGTNHLGHFLLVNLLQPQLSPEARIVVTASSVHDPATGDPGAQAGLGKLVGLEPGRFGKGGAAMVDGGAFNAGKAYKDSKLCNVLFTLELARRLKLQGSKVTVNCLSPGLIPSKTFFRNQNQTFSNTFAWAATNILRIAETTEFGGDTLCYMALQPSLDGKSGLFYSAVPPGAHVFVERTPSPEARDEAEAAELWKRSAALVGV